MASVTIAEQHPGGEGNRRVVYADVDITSYSNGGESVSPDDFQLGQIVGFDILDPVSDTGHAWHFDYSNNNIDAYTFDYDAASDGPAIEASDTTDVGQCRVRVVGIG